MKGTYISLWEDELLPGLHGFLHFFESLHTFIFCIVLLIDSIGFDRYFRWLLHEKLAPLIYDDVILWFVDDYKMIFSERFLDV